MRDLIILAIAAAMVTYCLTESENRKHKSFELQRQLDSIEAAKDSLHIDSTDLG